MKQPEALRLAKILQEESQDNPDDYRWQAGQEIERLHEANQALLKALKPFAVYGRIGSKDIEVGAAIAAIAKGEQQ